MPFDDSNFAHMSNELMLICASQLDDQSLMNWSETSKAFDAFLKSDFIWAPRFQQAFPECQDVSGNYLQAYQQQMTYKEKLFRYFGEKDGINNYLLAYEQHRAALVVQLKKPSGLRVFQRASEAVRDDVELAALVIRIYGGRAFRFISERVRKDPDSLMKLIESNCKVIDHIPDDSLAREDVLSARLFNSQVSCQEVLHATTDKDVALRIIEQHSDFIYQLRNMPLGRDRDILALALGCDGTNFCFLEDSLRAAPDLMSLAIANGGAEEVLKHGINIASHPEILGMIARVNEGEEQAFSFSSEMVMFNADATTAPIANDGVTLTPR